MSKLYDVSQKEVENAWKAVRKAGGAAGFDGKTIEDIEFNLDNELYKIWNRMASGSYNPPPVLLVNIPKLKGGMRQLGIPTVLDRVAQCVIKNRLEKIVQPHFHENSYAYQAGKSAIEAIGICRQRCMQMKWIVEIDIKGFFDNIDHKMIIQMVEKYTQEKTILLYVKKFLKAKGITDEKEETARDTGTPQGGVISPVLANLYLHEAFDAWMKKEFPELPFERYADDIVVHCLSERQSGFIRNRIARRLKLYKLDLNLEKTRIVYTGKDNAQDKRGHECPRKFTFLGYDFKPRMYFGKVAYSPAISVFARLCIRREMKKIKHKIFHDIEDIAKHVNPKIRGWINYYGNYRRSELYKMARDIDEILVRWIKSKHKNIASHMQGWNKLRKIKEKNPKLFCHWYGIISSSPARAV